MAVSPRRRDWVTPVMILVVAVLVILFTCLCCVTGGIGLGYYVISKQLEPTPEPTPASDAFHPLPPSDAAERLAQQLIETQTTDTDYWLLHGWMEDPAGKPASREPVQGPTDYQVGDVHTFWMGDEENQRYWQIDAELKIETDHTYVYVSQGTTVDMDKLRKAADLFESQIYPTDRHYFGSEWTPGIDNDPHVTILVTDQMPAGIAGYFSSGDEYPQTMKGYSNEREMFYITSSYLNDTDQFGQVLSHEFQHMIHWNMDRSEALWVNEGLSLLAEEVNGYPSVLGGWQFWLDPDIQLTNWAEDPSDRTRNYAASKLFLSFLGEHYGGYEVLGRLSADDAYGIDGIDNLLRAEGYEVSFDDVFADWAVANLLNDETLEDGRYSYALRGNSSKPRFVASLKQAGDYASWVSQFGADYIEIDPGAGRTVVFEGAEAVRLIETSPHGGQSAWWSNRRNMLSSSLTRSLDLREVSKATLHFWTWYDIEAHFDYGYVAVSTDGGLTWQTLPGTHTTASDPNQANFGNGYTGKSGGWLEERIDLGSFAGQEVLLRFWYISDPGLNQPGWMIDDISIPEIGFSDDAEYESEWTVDGFVRSSNEVPQEYIVQLVEYGPQTTIRRLSLDAENKIEVQLDDQTRRAVLIVSGAARWTSEKAPYRVQIKP